MPGEDEILPVPNLKVAQHQFTLSSPNLAHLHADGSDAFLKAIEADGDRINYWLIQYAHLHS
jgi:26S proteasome regulatory subunit N7